MFALIAFKILAFYISTSLIKQRAVVTITRALVNTRAASAFRLEGKSRKFLECFNEDSPKSSTRIPDWPRKKTLCINSSFNPLMIQFQTNGYDPVLANDAVKVQCSQFEKSLVYGY